MKKWTAAGLSVISAAAIAASLGAGTALAAGTTDISDIYDGAGASWTVPSTPMTNTIWKDKNGKVVDANTAGATQYKVLTTWAEAWSTSGPDYLGVSNSAYFGNGGNGNAKVTDYTQAQKNSMVGIWATSANESPNAYNWNTFYNFYAQTYNKTATDWATTSTTTNGGSDWDSSSGVWCGFKYRPEVVWTNNNLSADAAATYIKQIQQGQYSATAKGEETGSGQQKTTMYTPDADSSGNYDSSFAVYGDSTYDPQIISPNNNSPYSFVASAYELADAADTVIKNTANNPGLSSGETLNWKTVNKLPRSSRYTETPDECALSIEKLARGSAYYTLSQLKENGGTVDKKKVAYVAYPPSYSSTNRQGQTTTYTDATHVVVAVYDYTENIGSGPMDGRASWSPLVVDQLSTDDVYAERTGGTAVSTESSTETDSTNSTTTYTLYNATADDLADCDVIYSPQNSYTASEWQKWIEDNATPTNAAKASNISYVAASPAVTNGSNFTMEKLMYGAFALDSIYPELFPNMQLSTYWYSEVYHIKAANLAETMSWGYANASLPTGTSLATIGTSFDADAVNSKFETGYQYYQKSKGSDATIKRVLANQGLDGATTYTNSKGTEYTYAFNGFQPSSTWVNAHKTKASTTTNAGTTAKKTQTLKVTVSKKTIKYSKLKKKKQTAKVTVKKAKGKVSYSKAKKTGIYKKVTISSKGKITFKKGAKKGTYKFKVKAAKTSTYKASKTYTVTIKVK